MLNALEKTGQPLVVVLKKDRNGCQLGLALFHARKAEQSPIHVHGTVDATAAILDFRAEPKQFTIQVLSTPLDERWKDLFLKGCISLTPTSS